MVGTTGFEPAAYYSRSNRATKLRHVPRHAFVLFVCTLDYNSTMVSRIQPLFLSVWFCKQTIRGLVSDCFFKRGCVWYNLKHRVGPKGTGIGANSEL